MLEAHHEDHEIDYEQQDDRDLKDEHPTIGLVVIEQLIEVVEGLEFAVDGLVPITQVKASCDIFIDAGEMPVAKKFRDIGSVENQRKGHSGHPKNFRSV